MLSQKGWIRALKGHGVDPSGLKFKDGDSLFAIVELNSTDKLILMTSDGRAFTVAADKLPGGRGHGEPIRLSIDLEDHVDIITLFKLDPSAKRLVASDSGYGFIVAESDLESTRKAGKQVVTCAEGSQLKLCTPFIGDHIAVVGTHKKLLIFSADQLPQMSRGKGVKLQNYKGPEKLADMMGFAHAYGFSVTDTSGRNRAFPEWEEWLGKRAQTGKLVPKGFPRTGLFSA